MLGRSNLHNTAYIENCSAFIFSITSCTKQLSLTADLWLFAFLFFFLHQKLATWRHCIVEGTVSSLFMLSLNHPRDLAFRSVQQWDLFVLTDLHFLLCIFKTNYLYILINGCPIISLSTGYNLTSSQGKKPTIALLNSTLETEVFLE